MTPNDLFEIVTLTDAVNKLPPTETRLAALFSTQGIRTTALLIDVKNGRLTLIHDSPRGSNGVTVETASRKAISFRAAHLVQQAAVLPEDVQDIRAFGKEGVAAGLEGMAVVINDRLQELRGNLDITLEYHRVGALGGLVLDASGAELTNLYTAFGVTKQVLSMDLDVDGTNVLSKALEAKRLSESKLGGVLTQGFEAACSPEFFDALVGHKNVKAAYANWQAAQDRLGGDLRGGFLYGGIKWWEYNASVGGQRFIPEGVARFFPRANGVFKQYFAPADYNEAANSIGKEYYAVSEERPMGKGHTLEVQSNPITLCHYPEALIELTIEAPSP